MEALFEAAVRLAAPLLLAALGELLVERSGVVNIGVEGTMLTGAFVGFAVAVATGSAGLGVGAATLAGCAVGALFAFFAIARGTDQIVVGMAINLLALGATGLATRALYAGATPSGPTRSHISAEASPGQAGQVNISRQKTAARQDVDIVAMDRRTMGHRPPTCPASCAGVRSMNPCELSRIIWSSAAARRA